MALTRTRLIVLAVLVALLGTAGVLAFGDSQDTQKQATRNVIKIEAAGVNYAGWPEMGIAVNGNSIGSLTIDSQQRKMFTLDVPGEIDNISTVDIKFTNYTEPQSYVMTEVNNRMIIFRGLYLNDKKLEDGVPSGEKNTAKLLATSSGGISWKIDE